MARASDLLALVDDPSRQGLTVGDPADDALIALLAHVAFADGTVDDRELDFLQKVLPGRDREALRAWASEAGTMDLDLEIVAESLPETEERWACLRFAARMACKDGVIAEPEARLLERLVQAFELPEEAIARVIDEVRGLAGGTVPAKRLAEAVGSLSWRAVQHGTGVMRSDLRALVPRDAEVVHRIGLDNVEVLGFTTKGLVGRFLEGNAFLPWDDIVAYTRVPTLGASVQIVTEFGRRWTLVDHRLNGLGALFDRLYGKRKPSRPASPPRIQQVKGLDADDDPLGGR